MKCVKLVPNIFYVDIKDGLKLFVDCLDSTIEHTDLNSHQPLCVVDKDGLRINLFESTEYANEHHPEFRLVTKKLKKFIHKFLSHIQNSCIQTLRKLHFVRGVQNNLH